jgi:GNAT superfamily N-acetyltransferase
MFWRLPGREFDYGWGQGDGSGNREKFRALVTADHVPGLLAYVDGEPAAWCCVGPRADFPRLERSPTLGPIDRRPVWSIVCFYIHGSYKRQGLGSKLLGAAVDFARERGATIVEGYPVKPGNVDPFTGFESMFAAAGFREVRAGKGRGRSVWRRSIRPRSRASKSEVADRLA